METGALYVCLENEIKTTTTTKSRGKQNGINERSALIFWAPHPHTTSPFYTLPFFRLSSLRSSFVLYVSFVSFTTAAYGARARYDCVRVCM